MKYSERVIGLGRSRLPRIGDGLGMARVGVTLLLVALGLASGCRKQRTPSEEFTQAHELFARLYAAKLDDAFADPEMGRVEQLLTQVREDSVDFTGAQELLLRVQEGRARMRAADNARRAASAQALAPTNYQRMLDDRPSSSRLPPAEDGGSSQPVAGMALEEFNKRFSGCFQSSGPINVLGQGLMNSWELRDIANCRDRHASLIDMAVLTDARQVTMTIAKTLIEYRLPDGGPTSKSTESQSAAAR